VACLMALPHAPQFVAFDRGVVASHSDHAYLAAVSQASSSLSLRPSLPAAAVVPAGLRTSESQSGRARDRGTNDGGTTAKVVHARVHTHDAAGQQLAPARVVAADSNAAPPQERVVEASASADQETVPQFRTLIFIEATQYRNSGSTLWSVQVWRVMLVSSVRDRLAGAPVANSI
jgi:hypothetical protein